jgi:catechol 2,3-dioxygenase-like lactoylglutathione lyase family enzyme
MAEFPKPREGIVLTHFIVSEDVERSRRFYADVLGGETVRSGEPSCVALANGFIIINVGGGPTEDKPTVTLETPPDVYEEWSGRGAEFLAPPEKRKTEYRCYMRDPDGHLIEVGQSF